MWDETEQEKTEEDLAHIIFGTNTLTNADVWNAADVDCEDPVDEPQHFLPAVVNTLTPTERCQSLSNDIR